jgi:hypothetical protein
MSKFYKKLDLPRIPEHLINMHLDDYNYVKDIGHGVQFQRDGKDIEPIRFKYGYSSHEPLLTWIKENIHPLTDTGLMCKTSFGEPTGSEHIVHTDIRKVAHLSYWTKLGGDNVVTSWYWEKGKPLFRTKSTGGKQSDDGVITYDHLKRLDSVVFEDHCWYLFCANVLHDATGITGIREGFEIPLRSMQQLEDSKFMLDVYSTIHK